MYDLSVTEGMQTATLMAFRRGYYDEVGRWVEGRDPNWYTTGYHCSNGHQYEIRRRSGESDIVTLLSTLTISGNNESPDRNLFLDIIQPTP